MELEIRISCESVVPEGCQSSPTLPRWSKTGRRTRATRSHHQGLVASDDETRGLPVLESDEFIAENLPPKKRKMDSTQGVNDGNDVSGRNGKDLGSKMMEKRERKQHTCNICSRSFSSYQALGGHKAHHNTKGAPAAEGDAVVECGEPPGGGSGPVHRCTYCYKVFLKGQALGGHRRHCQRPTAIPEKMFSFDLNKLPPDWLEP